MVRLSAILAEVDRLWPFTAAAEWDNVGLLVGAPAAQISKVTLVVDVTESTVREALANGSQLLIAHHPLILQGQKVIVADTPVGSIIHEAIKSGLGIVALHTNADHPESGVSESLAIAIGMQQLDPLDPETGHGRVGTVIPQTLKDFADLIATRLPKSSAPIRVAGDPDRVISRIAVLAGSGASYMELAKVSKADVFVTSDVKHHQAIDFLAPQTAHESAPALIDVSHWAAERVWLEVAARRLGEAFPELNFVLSEISTDPWTFCVQP